jgi:hypothetical protein
MPKPGASGKPLSRCGARVRNLQRRHPGRTYIFWQSWPAKGRKRCRYHGGLSTGPRTVEGKARTNAARMASWWRRYEALRALKAAGLIDRFPWGRKKGWGERERQAKREAQERAALEAREPWRKWGWREKPKGNLTDLARAQRQILVMLVSLPANSPLRSDPRIAAIIERYKRDG